MFRKFNSLIKTVNNRDYYLSLSVLKIVIKNRLTLRKLSPYVTKNDLSISDDSYGISEENLILINKPMGLRLTHIDLLQFLSKILKDDIVYTEIGVSVLKNFYLLSKYLENSQMFAFDRNSIYPKIEANFIEESREKNITNYVHGNNKITYLIGDVHSEDSFNQLLDVQNKKNNFIFSDADHSEEGIYQEYDFYYKKNLAHDFILYFDDINSVTYPALEKIVSEIKKGTNKNIYTYTFWINGWLGKNQNQHKNAIISTYNIEKELRKHKIKLKNFNVVY
jgi:hypothetical protein